MKPDQELDALLAGLREEPWPEERLPAFRARVLSGCAPRRRRWLWLLPAPALAAAALLFVLLRPQPATPPAPSLVRTPAAPVLRAAPATAPAVVARRTPRRAPAPPPRALLAQAPAPTETQFIRIMTDDPDVVILWAVHRNGEAQ
jgi:hypothetical protein